MQIIGNIMTLYNEYDERQYWLPFIDAVVLNIPKYESVNEKLIKLKKLKREKYENYISQDQLSLPNFKIMDGHEINYISYNQITNLYGIKVKIKSIPFADDKQYIIYLNWCSTNCKNRYGYRSQFFWFVDKQDATLFKLFFT